MRIPFRKNQPVPKTSSKEVPPARGLDEIIAVSVKHVQECFVIRGNDEAIVQSFAKMDQSFIWDLAKPFHCHFASWVMHEDFCSDHGTLCCSVSLAGFCVRFVKGNYPHGG